MAENDIHMLQNSINQGLFFELVENSRDGINISQNGRFKYVNKAFCEMVGYSAEELYALNASELLAAWDRERIMKRHNERMQGKEFYGLETTCLIHKNGTEIPIEFNGTPIQVEGQNASFITIRNISERLKTEKKLEKFRQVLEQAPGAVYILDKHLNFEYVNPFFTQISGYSADELLNKNMYETVYKGQTQVPESRMEVSNALKEGKNWQGELHTINKNGQRYWANTIAAPFRDNNGEIDGYIIIQQDITDKKKIESELAEKENLYRTLIEKSLDGVIITQDGKVLMVNKAFADMIGCTIEECIATFGPHSIVPEDRDRVVDIHFRRAKGELGDLRYTASLFHKNGGRVTIDFNTTTIEINKQNASLVTARDITELSRIQDELEKSETKYKTLVENSQDGILIVRSNKTLYANNTLCRMLNYPCDELLAIPSDQFIHDDDKEKTVAVGNRRKAGDKSTLSDIYRLVTSDGNIIYSETHSTVITYEGLPASLITVHNITEKMRMEQAIQESEKKYRELTEMLPQTVYELDANGNFIYFNQAANRQFGLDNSDIGKSAYRYILPDHHDKMRSNIREIVEKKANSRGNKYTAVRKNGETFDALTFASPVYSGDKVVGIRGIMVDISEQVAMEKALLKSEEKYRDLTELLPQTVYELDASGNIVFFNQTGYKQFGLDKSDLGKSSFRFIHPSQHEQMRANMHQTITYGNISKGNKYTAVRKNGETFPAMTFAAPIYSEGKITGIRGLILDVSDHEAMENALRNSEEKYRTLIDNATDGIVITQNGLIKFSNPSMCEMMEYSQEELLETPYLNYVLPEDHQVMVNYHKRRMAGENFTSIYRSRFLTKSGKVIIMELNARTSEYNGNPAAFIIIRNITDRIKIESELQNAKTELEKLNQYLEQRVHESSQKLTEANTQLIRLQKENLQSQFEVLRQQVNPHFLFNSLNVLTSLIKLEPDLAEKFTEHLSKVYRYVLENKDNDLVNLQTELDFLDAYIFLLNIRFMDKIVVKVSIPENRRELLILPLALQLLIENAIKHNSMSKRNPLKIEIFIDKNNILNVVNNLQERESHMASTGVGLRNIQHRYHLLEMPAPEFLKTETKFIARIPLKG